MDGSEVNRQTLNLKVGGLNLKSCNATAQREGQNVPGVHLHTEQVVQRFRELGWKSEGPWFVSFNVYWAKNGQWARKKKKSPDEPAKMPKE